MSVTIETELTKYLGIKYPIILAGMNKAAGPTLAAAVTNAGGLGVIGGVGFTPKVLKKQLNILKSKLIDKNAPFGVDLLIPKVGNNARKTNYDYTYGKLNELIDVIIQYKTKLFVCAVGACPKHIVNKLHKHNILVMNMVGKPKHVIYAINNGVDMICPQGSEAGGHTGEIYTTTLLPKVCDMVKHKISPLTGNNIMVIGAGGIYNGNGLAMALTYGCSGVWIGTRFVCSTEAGATISHKKSIINATLNDTYKTLVYTGRPCRIIKNKYVDNWNNNREKEMKKLLNNGIIPINNDFKNEMHSKNVIFPHFAGQASGNIYDIKPAKDIILEIINDAVTILRNNTNKIKSLL